MLVAQSGTALVSEVNTNFERFILRVISNENSTRCQSIESWERASRFSKQQSCNGREWVTGSIFDHFVNDAVNRVVHLKVHKQERVIISTIVVERYIHHAGLDSLVYCKEWPHCRHLHLQSCLAMNQSASHQQDWCPDCSSLDQFPPLGLSRVILPPQRRPGFQPSFQYSNSI